MNYEEEKIQKGIVSFFYLKHPKLKGLLCCNLNNSKDIIAGARNKALGVVAGRSDLVLYYQQKAYHIEVKQKTTTQSKEQVLWQQQIELQGFVYIVLCSTYDFNNFLLTIGL